MSYCSVDDVKKMSGITPKNLGYKDKEDDFDNLIKEWIEQSESLIDSYCLQEWEKEVPLAVKNVCIRLTANIIAFNLARKDNPIRKVNDFSLKVFGSEVFTEDLRQDLKPFRKTKKIKVFRI